MAIEFRCTNCERLLRTPDGTGGRDAKCPQCGTIVKIPDAPPPPPIAPLPATVPPAPVQRAAPQVGNPYSPPASLEGGVLLDSPAEEHRFVPTVIDLGDILNRSWEIFKVQWPACLAAVWGTTFVLLLYFAAVALAIGGYLVATEREPGPELLVAVPLMLPAFAWQAVALHAFLLKIARGEPATAHDLFAIGDFLLPAVGSICLASLAVLVGGLLCVVPGVIAFLMFSQCLNIVIDRRVGVIESLQESMRVTEGNRITVLLLVLVNSAIGSIAGTLTCGLSTFVVQPFTMLVMCVAYLAMTGQSTAIRPSADAERRFN